MSNLFSSGILIPKFAIILIGFAPVKKDSALNTIRTSLKVLLDRSSVNSLAQASFSKSILRGFPGAIGQVYDQQLLKENSQELFSYRHENQIRSTSPFFTRLEETMQLSTPTLSQATRNVSLPPASRLILILRSSHSEFLIGSATKNRFHCLLGLASSRVILYFSVLFFSRWIVMFLSSSTVLGSVGTLSDFFSSSSSARTRHSTSSTASIFHCVCAMIRLKVLILQPRVPVCYFISMRALMSKPSASKFFQRPEKKQIVLTPDEKMLILEEKQICIQLGVDQEEISKYQWLFDLIKFTKLPPRYARVIIGNPESGKVKYHDLETGYYLATSPLLGLFKRTLYEKVDHNKAAHVFQDKTRKLLPFMEDKLARERIGLASKRKQAERVNLVRDQKGKVTTSKTVRIIPDTSKMMVTRDYLLKVIVDKVMTKAELFGAGKRARQYSITLQRNRKQKDVKQQQSKQVADLSIAQVQSVYQASIDFYEKMYGSMEDVPQQVQQSKAYRNMTPSKVEHCIACLGISKQSVEEYWFGRVMGCLPLPPGWVQMRSQSDIPNYFLESIHILTNIHPSVAYLTYMINEFKNRFLHMNQDEKMRFLDFRQMTFMDFFDRPYLVDMYRILSQREQRECGVTSQATSTKNKFNDWIVMEGALVANLPSEHYHLVKQVEDYFCQYVDGTELWHPEVSSYGQIIWTNTITNTCLQVCPIANQLCEYIGNVIPSIPQPEPKDYNSLHRLIAGNEFTLGLLTQLREQKRRFLTCFIENKEFSLNLQGVKNNIHQLLFMCPFDFQSSFDRHLPAWMERILGQQYSCFLKLGLGLATTSDHLSILFQIAYCYVEILKGNDNWNTYFRTTLPVFDKNTKPNLEVLISHVFDQKERQRWLLALARNQVQQKIAQESKQKYMQARKTQFKQPVPPAKQNPEVEKPQVVDQAQELTAPSKKYFDYQDDYNYDNAHKLIDAINDWSPEPLDRKDQNYKQDLKLEPVVEVPICQDEAILDGELKSLKKRVQRTKKFSSSSADLRLLKKVQSIPGTTVRVLLKNGLLQSGLKDQMALADRKLRMRILEGGAIEVSRVQSGKALGEEQQISMFNSMCSKYSNTSVDALIQNLRQDQPAPSPLQTKVEPRQPRRDYFNTRISYPPIPHLFKLKDPHLIHVDAAEGSEFAKAFLRQKSNSTVPTIVQAQRSKHQYNRSNQSRLPSPHKVPLPKSSTKVSPQRPPSDRPPVNLRCLHGACSYLLNKEAVASGLSFDRLQVRKQLFSKNRGLKLINI